MMGSEKRKLHIYPTTRELRRLGMKNKARKKFLPANALFRANARISARRFWKIVTATVYLTVAFIERST